MTTTEHRPMFWPADYHQRTGSDTIQRAIELIADVHAPAREAGYTRDAGGDHFTLGYLTATIGSLLDAAGFPEHGPNLGRHSWLAVRRYEFDS